MMRLNADELDIIIQFARMWGQLETMEINTKDQKISDMLRGYDSEDMLAALLEWKQQFLAEAEIKGRADLCDFFDAQIEKLYQAYETHRNISMDKE